MQVITRVLRYKKRLVRSGEMILILLCKSCEFEGWIDVKGIDVYGCRNGPEEQPRDEAESKLLHTAPQQWKIQYFVSKDRQQHFLLFIQNYLDFMLIGGKF